MIQPSAGVRSAVEKEVEKAYEALATYAASGNANPKAVAVRKRMLDIFTEGWNQQEALIEELFLQVEILSKKIKAQQVPYQGDLTRPATVVDLITMMSAQMKAPQYDASKEEFRAQHLARRKETWADHF